MLKLLRKDLIAGRLALLAWTLLFCVNVLAWFHDTSLAWFTGIAMTAFLALGSTLLDDKYGTDGLWLCLPVRRCDLVRSRYMAVLVAVLLGTFLFHGLGAAMDLRFPETNFDAVLSPSGLLVFCGIPLGLACIYFPLHYRLGSGGAALACLYAQLPALLLGAFVFWAGPRYFGIEWISFDAALWRTPALVPLELIGMLKQSWGDPVFHAASLGGLLTLFLFSMRLSIRFEENRR